MTSRYRPTGRSAGLHLVLLAILATSSSANAITHTGNPGVSVVLTTQGPSWTLHQIGAASGKASLQACSDGIWLDLGVSSTTAPTAASFDAPPIGTWCAIEVELVDLDMLAEDDQGREVKLVDLDVTFTLEFGSPTTIAVEDVPTWNIELGADWLDYAATYLDPGEHRTVQAPGAAATAVVNSLEASKVYVDSDADAVTSSVELAVGDIAK
jgi:hypothetical protein